MATYGDILREIIEFHEKLNYDENTSIQGRVLDSINRAILNLWSKAEWTFRVRVCDMEYNPAEDDNLLPEDFLTFHHTGRVILMGTNGLPERTLDYIPFNEMMLRLKAATTDDRDTPVFYSLGGSINGGENQRSIFIFPKPADVRNLRLIYHRTAPQGVLTNLTAQIEGIPPNWHFVIKELAILFRLMDKSADISAQTSLVKTAIDAMMRDEPHGKEDMPRMQPAYAWRMRFR